MYIMKLWEHIQEDKYFLQKQHSNRIKFYKLHDKQLLHLSAALDKFQF